MHTCDACEGAPMELVEPPRAWAHWRCTHCGDCLCEECGETFGKSHDGVCPSCERSAAEKDPVFDSRGRRIDYREHDDDPHYGEP